jgi:hypothetical protein
MLVVLFCTSTAFAHMHFRGKSSLPEHHPVRLRQ